MDQIIASFDRFLSLQSLYRLDTFADSCLKKSSNELSPLELSLLLIEIKINYPKLNIEPYLSLLAEFRANTQSNPLCAEIAKLTALIEQRLPDIMLQGAQGESPRAKTPRISPAVCDPVGAPASCAAPVSIASDPAPDSKIAEQLSKLDVILYCTEHLEWHKKYDSGGKLSQTLCSYLIHKKEYDMLKFMLDHTNYYCGMRVSAVLAAAGDLDGLKWLRANKPVYDTLWASTTLWAPNIVVSKATAGGHLHILVWMDQIKRDAGIELAYWKSAVSGSHLNIIQWYFIAFPDIAKNLAGEIFAYAKDKRADNIVEWMNTVGLSPVN